MLAAGLPPRPGPRRHLLGPGVLPHPARPGGEMCIRDRCELWLEFVFDYNMEYADAFNPQVKSVDVLVFDSDDKLLFTKSAEVARCV